LHVDEHALGDCGRENMELTMPSLKGVKAERQRWRVIIVGGGFGDLRAAQALKSAPVEVTLIDRHNYHPFQPLLYQVATGSLSPGEIAGPRSHQDGLHGRAGGRNGHGHGQLAKPLRRMIRREGLRALNSSGSGTGRGRSWPA